MSGNRTALLGVAVAVAGALLLILFVVSGEQGAPGTEAEETVAVLRATEALLPGTRAEDAADRVERTEVPASVAPENRIADLGDLAGHEALRTVGPGEILVREQFARAGPLAGGLVVPAGYEALSVEAEPAPGVQGYVTPGSRVNVYVTVDAPAHDDEQDPEGDPEGQGQADDQFTQLVLAHVDVLAVTRGDLTGQARSPEGESPDSRVVLLLQVRPADAPVLVDAVRRGSLWFSLVNPDDPPPGSRQVDLRDFAPGVRTQAISEARAQQDTAVQGAADQ